MNSLTEFTTLEPNREIFVLGKIENHESLYYSLAIHHKFNYEAIQFFSERPSIIDLIRLTGTLTRARSSRIFIEEFFSPLGMLIFALQFLGLTRRHKVSLCVHNVHRWVFPPSDLNILKTLHFIIRRKLRDSGVELFCVSDFTAEYLASLLDRDVEYVPFLSKKYSHTPRSLRPTFIIPGNVEDRRRDYLTLLDAMKKVASSGVRFQVIFLGEHSQRFSSSNLLESVSEFKRNFPDILITYSSFVDQKEFDAVLCSATALISNLRPIFFGNDSYEIYGLSKESGINAISQSLRVPCLSARGFWRASSTPTYVYQDASELAELMRRFADPLQQPCDM